MTVAARDARSIMETDKNYEILLSFQEKSFVLNRTLSIGSFYKYKCKKINFGSQINRSIVDYLSISQSIVQTNQKSIGEDFSTFFFEWVIFLRRTAVGFNFIIRRNVALECIQPKYNYKGAHYTRVYALT